MGPTLQHGTHFSSSGKAVDPFNSNPELSASIFCSVIDGPSSHLNQIAESFEKSEKCSTEIFVSLE